MNSVIHSVMRQATLIDYPGRMSALMFTSGCNFRCGYCHNFEALHDSSAKTYSFEELGKILDGFKKQWTHAVTVTGGEPTLHSGLPETLSFIKERGFAIKLDSNGSNPDMLERVIPMVDYVAMDIKCPLERYESLVQYGNVENLKKSIELIMTQAKSYEFRTTMVENYYTPEDLDAMGRAVENARCYTVQAFVPHENLPDESLREASRTRPSFLKEAAEIIGRHVQNVVIRGA